MRPPALPSVIAGLSEKLIALRKPLRQCFIAYAPADSSLTGYVVRMLGARLRHRGVAVQTLARLPGSLKAPEPLPSCFLAQLRAGDQALFVLCTVSLPQASPPKVAAHVYDARAGLPLAGMDAPFTLPGELAVLTGTNRTSMPPRDREWLKLFEEMFRPQAEQDAGLAGLLAATEAQYLMDQGLWEAAASRFLALAGPPPARVSCEAR